MAMNYMETVDYLFSLLPVYQRTGAPAYKDNLENTFRLDAYFGHPHKLYKTIHVAGTNGKGSVSHMLAAVLQKAGYQVGLYTSPHLKDFRERIRINGVSMPEEEVVTFVRDHQHLIEEIEPSFFELTVAMAFHYFAQQKIDIAVVEVGLGGRLDSTNIICPVLSVITNIGMDHMNLLGDTIEKIAREKAGIIKESIPVVVGETQEVVKEIFTTCARDKHAEIYFADDDFHIDYSTANFTGRQIFQVYKNNQLIYPDVKLDLLGLYQKKNIITVLKVLDILRRTEIMVDETAIYQGLSNVSQTTGLLGRWQILDHLPLTICDTGHNEEGIRMIVEQLKQVPYKQLHIVLGMVSDKDVTKILSLLPGEARYYFTQASIPRALDADQLQKLGNEMGLRGNAYKNVKTAWGEAQKNADKNDLIFIGGSTFIVADALF